MLIPMHLVISADGRIVGAGPVMQRLLCGAEYLHEIFAIDHHPSHPAPSSDAMADIRRGRRATLRVRGREELALRGHGVELSDGAMLLDFGFGMSFPHAIKLLSLTESDFSPASNVIELLFMYEASQAILGEISRANEALEKERREAEHMSATDALTGLLNRRGFEAEFREFAPVGNSHELAVAALDLDLFKDVNDRFGHAAGDDVLVAVADALKTGVRRGDIVARTGGDEFLLLFTRYDTVRDLVCILERIIRRIEIPIPLENGFAKLSASAGISTFATATEHDLAHAIARADAALYHAKSGGGGCVTIAGQRTCEHADIEPASKEDADGADRATIVRTPPRRGRN
ncbi:MAG: GGDEF domain-containing protein [Paracoccus sp. (in: a-proteobacteria)]